MNLSESAMADLLAAAANQGAKVPTFGAPMKELSKAGLIGPDLGLTRKGTIEREKLMSARLDATF